jgi:exodeoxyribonuclease V alpha subunit
MAGLAQQFFFERTGRFPGKKEKVKEFPFWTFLEKMLEVKRLNFIDYTLTKKILSRFPSSTEASAAFICHLSHASRLGHLCITIEQDKITPSPEEIWDLSLEEKEKECSQSEEEACMHQLHSLIVEGAASFSFLHECSTASLHAPFPMNPIYKNGNCYYLQRNWVLESIFIQHLCTFLSHTEPRLLVDIRKISAEVSKMQEEGALLPEQANAVLKGSEQIFTIIMGGPGTGKTYTAGILIKSFLAGLQADSTCRILLAAPTGKAAANLEASIRRGLHGVEGAHTLCSQTLHSLLYKPKSPYVKVAKVIPADILLIDECSMIDIVMMGKLMEAIQPGTRLIMLGDPYQLPAVDAGSSFADMISTFTTEQSRDNPIVIELTKCLRTESKEIVHFAEAIKKGETEVLIRYLEGSKKEDPIRFIPLQEKASREVQKRLIHFTSDLFPKAKSIENPLALLAEFSKFRILTCMRKGPLGVEELNARFFESFHTKYRHEEYFLVPIIIAKNDYKLELFNGEMGLLVKSLKKDTEYAFFPGREKKEVRKISTLLLPQFEYAYCLSIHKSQGSEFDSVTLLLPEGSERFGREAFYTGVTRARRTLEVWSDPFTLKRMIQKKGERSSGIINRLRKK